MRKVAAWCALIIGLMLLIDVGVMLFEFARVAGPMGGIPWSWDLLANNPRWVVKTVAGALLLSGSFVFLLVNRDRPPSALSQPADPL